MFLAKIFALWSMGIQLVPSPHTHDTGAVTGTEPGVEFYTLPLIEINIAAFQPFNISLFKTNFNR